MLKMIHYVMAILDMNTCGISSKFTIRLMICNQLLKQSRNYSNGLDRMQHLQPMHVHLQSRITSYTIMKSVMSLQC